MAKTNPSEVAAKWATRTAAAVSDYKTGIDSVRVAPGESAAQAVDRMIAKLQALRDSGELAQSMRSVSLAEWQRAAKEKGAERLASGARQAQGKMAQFMTDFLPFVDSVRASLPPRGDMEQNLQRMMQNARDIAQYKRKR